MSDKFQVAIEDASSAQDEHDAFVIYILEKIGNTGNNRLRLTDAGTGRHYDPTFDLPWQTWKARAALPLTDVPPPKLTLALPDYEQRQIVIASDDIVDGERLVCVAIKDSDVPVAWFEAEKNAAELDLRDVIGGMMHSTKWHFKSAKPNTGNPVWPLYTRPQAVAAMSDEEIAAAFNAYIAAEREAGRSWTLIGFARALGIPNKAVQS